MPLNPLWADPDRPDARAVRSRNEKKHKMLGWMEECFCVNCGRSGGMISKDWAAHVFYLCNDCVDAHGSLPIPEVPEAVVKARG